jgi:hypothetical protein
LSATTRAVHYEEKSFYPTFRPKLKITVPYAIEDSQVSLPTVELPRRFQRLYKHELSAKFSQKGAMKSHPFEKTLQITHVIHSYDA